MAEVKMTMPKMGESIMEATILSWLKKPGDKIQEDESVLEVATDKVDTEIPSMYSGVLKEILAKEGDVVKVGSPIAIVEVQNGDGRAEAETAKPTPKSEKEIHAPSTNGAPHPSPRVARPSRFYSPLVKNIASQEGVSIDELESLSGSGKEGRVTKVDILAYVNERRLVRGEPITQVPSAPAEPALEDEIVQMDRMRKMIAERMTLSKRISAHVTSFVEADVTNVVIWRNRVKAAFQQKYQEGLTFTPVFVHAVCRAIKDYPMINIQVDGDRIVKKKDINIGMAVALPTGNLIVPVIRNADRLTLSALARTVNDFARRARDNKLKPDELMDGTFTVTNVGSFGNVMGTPIIMQPQVAILALGAIQKKPAVIETPYGDAIAIRHKMFLSHSYDHRVVDGALGGMLVRRVADYLERFDPKQELD